MRKLLITTFAVVKAAEPYYSSEVRLTMLGPRPLQGQRAPGIAYRDRLLELGQPGLHKQLGNGVHRLLRAVVHRLGEVGAV